MAQGTTEIAAKQGAAQGPLARNIDEIVLLRHELHRNPELSLREHRTSERVAAVVESWGFDVTRGIAGTGVVASLRRGSSPEAIAIRADIDALPIQEESGVEYASATPGVMHACGHDGHTAILLETARRLIAEGGFDGTVHLLFQPAEEGGGGAQKVIAEGFFERFPVSAIFGLHNWPGVPTGRFAFVAGPAMASVDTVRIRIEGQGGHGAEPHLTNDPIVAAAHVITALQSVVARNVPPLDAAVVTVGTIRGGQAANVIPGSVDLTVSVRAFRAEIRELVLTRIEALVAAVASGLGTSARVEVVSGNPSVINDTGWIDRLSDVAKRKFGEAALLPDFAPRTASEDFSWFLREKPGAFIFVGNGADQAHSHGLHTPKYRFNDDIIAPAAAFWVELVRDVLKERVDA
jgi:hippurate hydrolase